MFFMHIGFNHQSIFENEEDRIKFLDVIVKNKVVSGYRIFAYCRERRF